MSTSVYSYKAKVDTLEVMQEQMREDNQSNSNAIVKKLEELNANLIDMKESIIRQEERQKSMENRLDRVEHKR
jgi:hypothetical protein